MKIDSKFLSQQWFKSIAAEFGPAGQVAAIHILISIFESPNGYWRQWKLIDCYEIINEIPGLTLEQLDKIVDRMAHYGIFDSGYLKTTHILASEYLQREFIRQCGVARARRIRWDEVPILTPKQLLELGIISPIDESRTDDYGRPLVDADEPFGEPIPLPRNHPLHNSERRCIRVPSPDPRLHVYRPVRIPPARGVPADK